MLFPRGLGLGRVRNFVSDKLCDVYAVYLLRTQKSHDLSFIKEVSDALLLDYTHGRADIV